jgi:2-(1,2-epoxy-1,2-dihydrophenyl)acetyl-CoA isomerase
MAGEGQIILVEDEGGVRKLILNRPDVLNALSAAVLKALGAALREAERDKGVRCLVITGAGRAFSSGQDLGDVRDAYESGHPIDFDHLLRTFYNPVIAKIRTIEKPIVASVNGIAAGAGCSLAIACDVQIAAESASFMQAFINVGLVPDAGSTFMLPRLIGISRAMEMACTGRRISSAEALQIGLVNQVVPDSELASATMAVAERLAIMPTRAVGLTKRAINAAWNADLETQLNYEAALQSTASHTHDHPEGVAAFLEKRPPRFKGE